MASALSSAEDLDSAVAVVATAAVAALAMQETAMLVNQLMVEVMVEDTCVQVSSAEY